MKQLMVIFSNYAGQDPYKTKDIQFNHASKTVTFRDYDTNERKVIQIEEIDYIAFGTVDK